MGAKSALEVVLPVSFVLLLACDPEHGSEVVSLVVGPLALVVVAAGVGHFSMTPLHASFPAALVHRAILVVEHTVAVAHSIDPLAIVLDSLLGVDVLALAMSQAVSDLAFIGRAVGPLVTAETRDFVGRKFTLVNCAIGPVKLPLSVQQAMLELALVGVAVSELACALSMIDLADL